MRLAIGTATKPGDTVAVESPTFYGVLQAIESLRLKALEIPMHPRDGLSLEALSKALRRSKIAACRTAA